MTNVTTLAGSYRSNAEYLQGLVQEAKVVKGFNVLSAYALENGGLQGSKEVGARVWAGQGRGLRPGCHDLLGILTFSYDQSIYASNIYI